MKFTDNLLDLDSLEGTMLEEFIEITLEHIELMLEIIENDEGKINHNWETDTYIDIIQFHDKLLKFFEKLEDFETCRDIKKIIDFIESKKKS